MPKFRDIKPYTQARYECDNAWEHLEQWLDDAAADMEPDFQREHVWTPEQRSRYVEFCLRGGTSASDIYWNHPGWMDGWKGTLEIVDGKQRITTVRMFLRDEVPAFGHLYSEYEDRMDILNARFRFHVNDLQTRAEVIEWYLELNFAGTPHTEEELARVRALLTEQRRQEEH